MNPTRLGATLGWSNWYCRLVGLRQFDPFIKAQLNGQFAVCFCKTGFLQIAAGPLLKFMTSMELLWLPCDLNLSHMGLDPMCSIKGLSICWSMSHYEIFLCSISIHITLLMENEYLAVTIVNQILRYLGSHLHPPNALHSSPF